MSGTPHKKRKLNDSSRKYSSDSSISISSVEEIEQPQKQSSMRLLKCPHCGKYPLRGERGIRAHVSVSCPVINKTAKLEGKDSEVVNGICTYCNKSGLLICCDTCPAMYHRRCLSAMNNTADVGDGFWSCPRCVEKKNQKLNCPCCNTLIERGLEGMKIHMKSLCQKLNRSQWRVIYREFTNKTAQCMICHKVDNLIFCDNCTLFYHLNCLCPPLTDIPEGPWNCPKCISEGLVPGNKDEAIKNLKRMFALPQKQKIVLSKNSAKKNLKINGNGINSGSGSGSGGGYLSPTSPNDNYLSSNCSTPDHILIPSVPSSASSSAVSSPNMRISPSIMRSKSNSSKMNNSNNSNNNSSKHRPQSNKMSLHTSFLQQQQQQLNEFKNLNKFKNLPLQSMNNNNNSNNNIPINSFTSSSSALSSSSSSSSSLPIVSSLSSSSNAQVSPSISQMNLLMMKNSNSNNNSNNKMLNITSSLNGNTATSPTINTNLNSYNNNNNNNNNNNFNNNNLSSSLPSPSASSPILLSSNLINSNPNSITATTSLSNPMLNKPKLSPEELYGILSSIRSFHLRIAGQMEIDKLRQEISTRCGYEDILVIQTELRQQERILRELLGY